MPLPPGTRIGAYAIVAPVGAGGMGEVYRARDAKLGRDVAIKVLPEAFARDAERLARFRREAQALAALNDPHIAQIYHLEDTVDGAALVMEFVEGSTLADLVHGRPMETDDVVRFAGEIAAGLETAHEKGIVHRDLKPANVKITPEGRVKILDFGLAKAMAAGDEASHPLANSPTLTARATEAGIILGTAAYMSPEQARGKALDKRTDIWAFGCVLFEMLTGHRAFEGETVTDTLAAVLRSDPEWSALPAGAPVHVRALLARCLERDPSKRLRDIGEARLALAGGGSPVTATVQMSAATMPAASLPAAPRARPWPWIAAAALLGVALGAVLPTSSLVRGGASATSVASYELAIAPPPGAEFQIGSNSGNVIISPDGSRLAFVAATDKATTLWVRSLASDDARSIPGTENASNQFWSPDGRSIGFFANGKLWTVKIAGGLPEAIADAAGGRGGAWSEDGTIIFSFGGGAISRVAATGGTVAPQTTLDLSRGENAHYWPVFLPGGRRFLYFVRSTQVENGGIYLGHMDGSPPSRLVASLSSGLLARHPVSGGWYLLWARNEDLLAQPFEPESGTLSGDVTTIASGVRVHESQRQTYAAASQHGHLIWATARAAENTLALFARDGRRIRTLETQPGMLVQPSLSPDGRRLLFTRVESGGADIFMHDLGSGVTERLTTDPDYDEGSTWTPDGSAITYSGRQKGVSTIFRLTVRGGAAPEVLHATQSPSSGLESPDRRYVILSVFNPGTGDDIVARIRDRDELVQLLSTPGSDVAMGTSTDGKTLLIGQQSGSRTFVAVARVRTDGATPSLGSVQLVADGALLAALRPDGREVIAATADGLLKAIAITPAGDTLTIGVTSTLFALPRGAAGFTVDPTGTQFVISESPFAAGQTLRVLTRWDARLGR